MCISSVVATAINGALPDARRKPDVAHQAETLRLAGKRRRTQAAGAATGH